MGDRERDILYATAKDLEGNLIDVADASKEKDYFCPNCGKKMILRKSEVRLRRPHFAHKKNQSSCTPESVLHYSFKKRLYSKIAKSIKTSSPLIFRWECSYCKDSHKGNLVKKAGKVKLEYKLEKCQPDIALINKEGNVYAAIEIVVTHEPEEKVLKFYRKNDIILIKFNLNTHKDLKLLSKEEIKADKVDFCFNPKCEECGTYLKQHQIMIVDGECWRCENQVKIAILIEGDMGICGGPIKFDKQELQIAREEGVKIKEKYSKTVGNSYLANVCSTCDALIGEFFLPKLHNEARLGIYNYKCIQGSYYCSECQSDS